MLKVMLGSDIKVKVSSARHSIFTSSAVHDQSLFYHGALKGGLNKAASLPKLSKSTVKLTAMCSGRGRQGIFSKHAVHTEGATHHGALKGGAHKFSSGYNLMHSAPLWDPCPDHHRLGVEVIPSVTALQG